MRILHAAAEMLPIVRTGGLGDVLAALPVAQRGLGDEPRLLLPGYNAVVEALADRVSMARLGPRFGAENVELVHGTLGPAGLEVYVIDAPTLYGRAGSPYLGPDGLDWPDNAERFGLLGWIAAELAAGILDPLWQPDILHAHDWHAGLAPAYLALSQGPRPACGSVFTIHNLAFQGLFPGSILPSLGLPASAFQPAGLEFWGQVSFMKAGLVYADRVTTVSPNYAREIATADYGCGLEGVIAGRGAAVHGVLNGVDETVWDPKTDPALVASFEVDALDARLANRNSLFAEFKLAPSSGPLFGVVSRLTPQKGLDLLLEALPTLLEADGSLVMLGAGDPALEEAWLRVAAAAPSRIAVVLGYRDALSHLIFGGSDAVLVPSRFEPCGLTQLYALRYGAVPVVRRTGGLADTVVDATADAVGTDEATGILFDIADAASLSEALRRTAALYRQKTVWRAIQQRGMRARFSWAEAAQRYNEIYLAIRP